MSKPDIFSPLNQPDLILKGLALRMKSFPCLRVAAISASLLFCFFLVSGDVRTDGLSFSTLEQIKEDFDSVPCKNPDRLNAVRALFEKMGAPPSNISIDKHKTVENLIVSKEGATTEKIVIGAHYDKSSDGCGAIDNWSGIVALAHMYRTLKPLSLKKTILFVAFGREEEGLIGSRAMVGTIKKEELEQYCAMINLDSFGLAAPQVLENASNHKLMNAAAELAKEMKVPFSSARVAGADSDSSSFLRKKIPAVTLHGLSNEFASIIHTGNDQASKVNHGSVYLGYRLGLALAVRLDNSICSAYK